MPVSPTDNPFFWLNYLTCTIFLPRMEQFSNGNAIEIPHDNDILSGRGNYVNYHPGNEQFRALVRKHKVAYVACPKSMKGKFAEMIVEEVKQLNPPGRFLKQNDVTKVWYDIGDKKALDKTRQALREGAPEIQKEITVEEITIPALSKNMSERRASTGAIDPSLLEQALCHERRRASVASNPMHSVVDRCLNVQQEIIEMQCSSNVQIQMQQQQIPMPIQIHSAMMPPQRKKEDDPYCSSLPLEHFENFRIAPSVGVSHQAIAHNHNMSLLNPSLNTQFGNRGSYTLQNGGISRFPSAVNLMPSLVTVNEMSGKDCTIDNRNYPQKAQNHEYHVLNSQLIGSTGPTEYTFQQPNALPDQNFSISHSELSTQQWDHPALANSHQRQNRMINGGSRTRHERPEPIQLNSYVKIGPSIATGTRYLNDVPEKYPSLPSKEYSDYTTANPKSILRSITPRRMIINVQYQESRSTTPQRMETIVPDVASLRRGSPRNRSRLRGRRQDSTTSVLSTNSLAFDKIFSESADDKSKNGNSGASFLSSFMSLSTEDVESTVGENDQNNLVRSRETKSTTTKSSVKRAPVKRIGSSSDVYDMSVNTISVDDNDVASSSQDDMSFLHVFDEQSH